MTERRQAQGQLKMVYFWLYWMNVDSPAATSGGSGRSRGCDGAVVSARDRTPGSLDLGSLHGALQRLLGNLVPDRRIELRERALEGTVFGVALDAVVAGGKRVAGGVIRI